MFRTKTVLAVAAGVLAGVVGLRLTSQVMAQDPTPRQKTVKWEHIVGDGGTDLVRTETPTGWIIDPGPDRGLFVFVPDPEKKWLGE